MKTLKMKNNYNYILFDLDDTLFSFKESEKNAIIYVLNYLKINITKPLLERFSYLNDLYCKEFENKIMTRLEFQHKRFTEFFKEINVSCDIDEINKMFIKELSNGADLNPHAKEVVEELSLKYDLFIASNGMKDVQISRLKKAGIYQYFKNIYISSEIGYNKPHPCFFEYIINDIGNSDKSKYIMIGDRLGNDIIGAKNFGIDAIYYHNTIEKDVTTISDLKELLKLL